MLSCDADGWPESDWSATNLRVSLTGGVQKLVCAGLKLVDKHDLVHFHDVWSPAIAYLARWCFKQRIPYVVMPHGAIDSWAMMQKSLKKKVYLSLLGRRMLERAGALHLLNEAEVNGLRSQGLCGRYFILPNGIDPMDWTNMPPPGTFRKRFPQVGDMTIIAFMARLHHKKGPDILAQAFASIAEDFPDTFLVIAGPDYGLKDTILSLLSRYFLQGRSVLTGMLTGHDRMALLQDADIFALPSHQEGHPVGVVEAAFLGKSLLITPTCNCPELVNAVAAEVVNATPEAVAEGLRRLLADGCYRQRLGQKAREIAAEYYVWNRIGVLLSQRYHQVISGQSDLRVF